MYRQACFAALLLTSVTAGAQTSNYVVTDLVTSTQDARLVNPWGLSRPSKSTLKENEWWANDQVTGVSTLYDASGKIYPLAVTVPAANGSVGSPTGTVYNAPAVSFAFATLDGTLSVWSAKTTPATPGTQCAQCHVTNATIAVNHAALGASYQGLAIAKNATTGALAYYLANANGGVEAYDATSFAPLSLPAGAFTDKTIPAGYTPAGIQAIGSQIYVAYNAAAGGGTGYVDAFDTNGKLQLRLQTGSFNQPWGVALAPSTFGTFSGAILVGNTGDGTIGAYNKKTGAFLGYLQNAGVNLTVPGLWALSFGNGNVESGPANVLYFTAGGPNLTSGTFGAIAAQ